MNRKGGASSGDEAEEEGHSGIEIGQERGGKYCSGGGPDKGTDLVQQVVDHDDVFASFRQRKNHMAADIAGTTGNEHGHAFTFHE